ncbi:hypothetical protein J6590_061651 [Homalodisca vitripennis]|nr:hypothetical protein J6590_061651 [Homalodisca vitripennis]
MGHRKCFRTQRTPLRECSATKEEHRLEIPIPNTLRQLKPTHTHSGDKPAGHQLAATKANNESEPFLPHGRSVVGDSSTAIPTTLVITGFSRAPRLPVYVLLWSLGMLSRHSTPPSITTYSRSRAQLKSSNFEYFSLH